MKKYNYFILVIMILYVYGCESMGENTKKSAIIGAVAGAAVGGIVGYQDGHALEGAVIGAAAGGTTGGVIGYQMDKNEK